MTKPWALIIHGGAGDYEHNRVESSRDFLRDVVDQSKNILLNDGARAAVAHAVRLMENHSDYNAGFGSRIQADGVVRMTACYMDNVNHQFSSAVNIEGIKNPIDVAIALQGKRYPNLAGPPATLWAAKAGFQEMGCYAAPHRVEEFKNLMVGKSGTVGACALDLDGVMAAATSTGGTGMETPGRLSDDASPCGNYCNDNVAISATGYGESIINAATVPKLAGLLDYGIPFDKALKFVCEQFNKSGGDGGLICVLPDGQICQWYNSTGMRYCGINHLQQFILS
jgi:L-asparaginase